ncbi:MFS transporter [Streptomyces sp. TUS-ST3]|uniref:YbfB/YjiJ family MFS transporter n=1 Tax=Streptomyces sp. TUS-ST3 TaxID=3025591 RepID=UPI00235B357B|nr:YbfB/YjiJ family MFS transporter [Streptomyces sp. TUS-ST3]GLP67100.1 MFS transporter [Streptomyces sp. TUS-ST3]
MTLTLEQPPVEHRVLGPAPWAIAVQGAAALAAGNGVGRFVFTPILPLMHDQAGLSATSGANLATANYVGYLAGALAGSFAPRLVRSRLVMRASMIVMAASLALMPLTQDVTLWSGLRLIAGFTSALAFVHAVGALLSGLRRSAPHLVGWGFGGIGAGIVFSGLLVLAVREVATWRTAWWIAAVLTLLLTAASWNLAPPASPAPAAAGAAKARPRTHRWFAALALSYTLEGIGYIIAGTFLVASITQDAPGWVGAGAWVVVGLAAIPGSAWWTALARRWSRPTLLAVALLLQAAGIALTGLVPGNIGALVAAAAFGGTFVGITSLALALGEHLQVPRAVALLTAGYGTGQIIGPLISRPLLGTGYSAPLLLASTVLAAATLAAAVLRIRYPHRVGHMIEPSHLARKSSVSRPPHLHAPWPPHTLQDRSN